MNTTSNATILIATGTAGMMLLAIAIIVFVFHYQKKMLEQKLVRQQMEATYQREMLLREMEAQESERSRISKELHDSVGVMVQSILTNVQSLGTQIATDIVQDITQAVHETHQTVRDAAFDLMPASLQRFGLSAALSDLIARLSKRSTTTLTFLTSGAEVPLSDHQRLLLFRMAQEALANALKHAHATHIEIQLNYSPTRLEMSIADDGVGINLPEAEKKNGLGLFNLRTRAQMIMAEIVFLPCTPRGTCVTVYLPLSHG